MILFKLSIHLVDFNLSFFEYFKTSHKTHAGSIIHFALFTEHFLVHREELQVAGRRHIRYATVHVPEFVYLYFH